jgi:hypothetical protein
MQKTPEFIDAVCELIKATIAAQCEEPDLVNDDALDREMHTVVCAFAVLREIRAAQEFSSLHRWADRQLSVHADALRSATEWVELRGPQ